MSKKDSEMLFKMLVAGGLMLAGASRAKAQTPAAPAAGTDGAAVVLPATSSGPSAAPMGVCGWLVSPSDSLGVNGWTSWVAE